MKFTTVYRDGVNCPRGTKACACRTLDGRYTVVSDEPTIAAPDTDTGRLSSSGAVSVLWCLARPDAHAEAWGHLKERHLPDIVALITEGNGIVGHLSPDLLVMVMSPATPRDRWKPDTGTLLRRADIVIVNTWSSVAESSVSLSSELAAMEPGARPIIQDVTRPLAEWGDTTLRDRIARLLGPVESPAA